MEKAIKGLIDEVGDRWMCIGVIVMDTYYVVENINLHFLVDSK